MWGTGLNGRLGNGENDNQLQPELSQELKDKAVAQIIMGTNTTFAIVEISSQQTTVYGWGSSKNGKLGFQLANGKIYDIPREIMTLEKFEIY